MLGYNGCSGGRRCTRAVTQKCVATGYRNMRCISADSVATQFPTGVPTTPPDGVSLPDACYRCVDNAICASNGTDCNWSPSFQECLNKCSTPQNITNPCLNSHTICDCFNVANSLCAWCQYSQTFTDTTTTPGTTVTVSKSRCMNTYLANKCTGDKDSLGYSGSLITVKPTSDCSSTSISPNVNDPASAVTDPTVAATIRTANSAAFSAATLQTCLPADIIVDYVSQAFTDGVAGKIQCTIQDLGSYTNDQIKTFLVQALIDCLNPNIQRSQVSVELLPATSAKKRQAGSPPEYLANSSVQPASSPNQPGTNGTQPNPPPTQPIVTSSGFTVSPVCFFILLLALPLWSF